MPSDAERFRFLEQFKLSVTRSNDEASVYWRGKDSPGMPGGFRPIAKGRTLEEAVDNAIARWERAHRRPYVPDSESKTS